MYIWITDFFPRIYYNYKPAELLSFIWYTIISCWLNPLHPIGCSFSNYDPSLYSLILRNVPIIVPSWHTFAYIMHLNINAYFLVTYGSQVSRNVIVSTMNSFKWLHMLHKHTIFVVWKTKLIKEILVEVKCSIKDAHAFI